MPTGITITEKELEELCDCLETLKDAEARELQGGDAVVVKGVDRIKAKQRLIERALAVIWTSAWNPMS